MSLDRASDLCGALTAQLPPIAEHALALHSAGDSFAFGGAAKGICFARAGGICKCELCLPLQSCFRGGYDLVEAT